jgi:hypothetical protein
MKLLPCPFCRKTGLLILHGFLYGYHENSSTLHKRGRRIICNKRRKRIAGCGKSFSLLMSSLIPLIDLSRKTLWDFLTFLKKGRSVVASFIKTGTIRSERTIYGFFRRFRLSQPAIRTLLLRITSPPESSEVIKPFIQTIIHLEKAFPDSLCPVEAFQRRFNIAFM